MQQYFRGFLNDDCWRHVLDYASLMDVMSLGRVCRQWEAVVERYLEGVRIRIETITNVWDVDEEQRRRKCRILVIKDDRMLCLNAVLYKWGHLVAELVYDARLAVNEHVLRRLGSECPNIQDITFVRLKWHSSTCDWAKKFTKLKRVCFENCSIVDGCVSELIKNNNIEELVFRMTDTITGSFLLTGDGGEGGGDLTKLNTLILSRCSDLGFEDLLSAVEPVNYLAEVRKLELRDLPPAIHKEAHLVLEKMPQLEQLTFDCTEDLLRADVVRAVSQLGRLQVLGWLNGEVLSGNELQAALKDARLTWRRSPPPAWSWQGRVRGVNHELRERQQLHLLFSAQRRRAQLPPPAFPVIPNLVPPDHLLELELAAAFDSVPPPHPVP